MARPIIELKITREKIDPKHCFKGKKGTYLDAALFENERGRDEFENDGFISQRVSKEAREAGEKGPIIGNWKYVEKKKSYGEHSSKPKPPASPPADPDLDAEDSIPF